MFGKTRFQRPLIRFTFSILALILLTSARADEPAITSIAELERLPVGIRVTHSPETVKAVKKLPIDGRRLNYTWVYRTEVTAMDKDLKIIQFGAFLWDGTKWQLGETNTGTPFGEKEFVNWYGCENSFLKKGQSASDPMNFHTAVSLDAGKYRWFFVGVDAAGKRFAGDAVVEFVAELGDRLPIEPLHRLSGSWKKKWTILQSEWNPKQQEATGTHVTRWSLNGHFLKEEGKDSDGSNYVSMTSFDEPTGQYLHNSFSSSGLNHRLVGSWDEKTSTMIWRNTERAGLTEEWKYRLTGPDHYEFEFQIRGEDQKVYFHLKGSAERDTNG
jgi:hypothetical protein